MLVTPPDCLSDPAKVIGLRNWVLRKTQAARTNINDFMEFVMVHELHRTPIKVARHQRVGLNFMLNHERSVNFWPVGHAKCLAKGSLVLDGKTGCWKPIESFKGTVSIAGWKPEDGIQVRRATAIATGVKRCLRITLRSGLQVETTPEHPYLTPLGWSNAESIRIGETIGTPRYVPEPKEYKIPIGSEAWVTILAVLTADGSLTGGKLSFTKPDPILVEKVRHAVENMIEGELREVPSAKGTYSIVNAPNLREFIKECGLWGKLSKHKHIPEQVFRLPNKLVQVFINTLWGCDGTISKTNGACITLASKELIQQLQLLLLRFSIQSGYTYRKAKCKDKYFDSWILEIRSTSIQAFSEYFPLWGHKAQALKRYVAKKRNPNTGLARISVEAANIIEQQIRDATPNINALKRSIKWKAHASLREVLFTTPCNGLVSIRQSTQQFIDKSELLKIAFDEAVAWDEVVKIEDIGEREVFDLTVPDGHNFIASGVIAHNTFSTAALALFLMGKDPTMRGAIVSATQEQAKKPLSMVRDYIETSVKLRAVFPNLRPSQRTSDPWTQTSITVDRPEGIRDPSLVAVGIGGALPGSRLSWVLVDDILNMENTGTKESRDKVYEFFDSSVLSRMDLRGAKIIITNTAWHTDDMLHRLEKAGWPTMRMSIDGNIMVSTPPQIGLDGVDVPDTWGIDDEIADYIRPATDKPDEQVLRLVSEQPDPDNTTPLWPEVFTPPLVEKLKRNHLPHRFNQLFCNNCRDDATARCKDEWIELCKQKARDLGHYHLLQERYLGDGQIYTGVDLAIEPGEEHDDTSFFTFEVLPSGLRRILDIDVLQCDGPTIINKIIEKHRRFNSIIRVENNAAQQYIIQFTRKLAPGLPVKPHTTGRNKVHPTHGVESMFVELSHGIWLIPNDKYGRVEPVVQKFIDACLFYSPSKHTPDVLMSAWLAREMARAAGALVANEDENPHAQLGMSISSR
jgi:intein/homing endonuclease